MPQAPHTPSRIRRMLVVLFKRASQSVPVHVCISFTLLLGAARQGAALDHRDRSAAGDISGTITDSTSGQPLPSAEVSVAQNGTIIANTQTDGFGRYTIHNLSAGSYVVSARMIGFQSAHTNRARSPPPAATSTNVDFRLVPAAVNLSTVMVTASVPIAVDTRTGNQVFKQNEYHGAPTNTTSQILQQSIAGAARAPTGEVHIRGQHAEYTLLRRRRAGARRNFGKSQRAVRSRRSSTRSTSKPAAGTPSTGTRTRRSSTSRRRFPPADFTAISARTSGPTTRARRRPRGFNGQSLSMSTNNGPWGFFFSGARQFSDMRIEPVILDPIDGQS